MTDPLRNFSTRSTPQSKPIPGRSDQVKNSAGGYVFEVDDWQRLRRFLVLGTDGGTYYTSEPDLTMANAGFIHDLVNRSREDGLRVVEELLNVSLNNLAPRQRPTLFVLALCAASRHPAVKAAAFEALPQVARTGTMLFDFVGYVNRHRGWGPSLRKAIARWYLEKPVDKLGLQVVKYRQRDGWSHRDLLRLAHPTTTDPERSALFKWIVDRDEFWTTEGGWTNHLPEVVYGFENAQRQTDAKAWVRAIIDARLPWEALPTEALREPAVMEALIPRMGLTALTRQLGRFASTGHLKPGSQLERLVLDRLRVPSAQNEKFIGEHFSKILNPYVQERVHPFQVLLALTTFQAGHGVRGKLSWTPTPKIVDALDEGFYEAFGSLEFSDKKTMVALDISGSMDWAKIMNTHITPRVASAAMALITLKSNPNSTIFGFTSGSTGRGLMSDGISPLDITPRRRIDDVVRYVSKLPFGGTDCALPMIYATENKLEVDTFVIYTDNETWAGRVHPSQALARYRESVNPGARLVVVGLTATNFTIADPTDAGSLDVVGFDASAPRLITQFSEGAL